jgi:hypothetical protein
MYPNWLDYDDGNHQVDISMNELPSVLNSVALLIVTRQASITISVLQWLPIKGPLKFICSRLSNLFTVNVDPVCE